MKFNDLKTSIITQFNTPNGHKFVPFILGKPGGGKSSCAREIAEAVAKERGIPSERIVEFNPSLREPTDILGLPVMTGECSKWLPPEEFYAIREGQGPSILIIEELSDAGMDMQNPLCRVILDRCAGQMKLSNELYIIATGNRTEDRSGAMRLSTKLANRMRLLNFEESLDDWLKWAQDNGVTPVLRQFIRFRPALLSDFDPNRSVNPTPRTWEDVSRIPMDMDPSLFFEHVAGCVGEGAASEYCGFIRIFESLPDLDEIEAHPTKAEVPSDPCILYALVAKLATMATKKNFNNLFKYIERMPPEFMTVAVVEASKECPEIMGTKAFTDFAMKSVGVFI